MARNSVQIIDHIQPLEAAHQDSRSHIFFLRIGFTQPLVMVLLLIAWMLSIDLHLANDGVEHLRLTLANGGVFPVSEARLYSYWLTQWVIELGLLVGFNDLRSYIAFYAFGIFLLYSAPWAIVCLRLRNSSDITSVGVYYALALGAAAISSSYLLGTEHQTIVPLTLLVSVLMLGVTQAHFGWNIVLLLSLYLLTRSYETSIVSFLFFGAYLVYLLIFTHHKKTVTITLLIGIAICFLGVGIAAFEIIQPRDVKNREGFIQHITLAIRNPVFITCCLCALAALIQIRHRAIAVGILVLATSFQLYCLTSESVYESISTLSFASRTFTLFVPAALIYSVFCLRRFVAESWINWMIIAPVALSGALIAIPFLDYRIKMLEVIQRERGFVGPEIHLLSGHRASWQWTFPSMSVVLQPECTHTVLLNNPQEGWQPYSPQETPGFGHFARYATSFYPELGVQRCSP